MVLPLSPFVQGRTIAALYRSVLFSTMQAPSFYDSAAWQIARRQALHDAGYRCERPGCGVSLLGMGQEAHVHHRKPYKRAPSLATEPLNLMAVCRTCHRILENEAKRSPGCDVEGRPLDVEHPWFEKT